MFNILSKIIMNSFLAINAIKHFFINLQQKIQKIKM